MKRSRSCPRNCAPWGILARPPLPRKKPILETELGVQEIKQTLNTIKEGVTKSAPLAPITYAHVAAWPKPENVEQRPNHTFIISSRNPQKTSEQVLTKIKVSLDLRSGVRSRKIKNWRCGSPQTTSFSNFVVLKNVIFFYIGMETVNNQNLKN